jgi:carbon-monoxide dehydrogenase large subunit
MVVDHYAGVAELVRVTRRNDALLASVHSNASRSEVRTDLQSLRGVGNRCAVLERGLDGLARASGLDPVELRRRNTLTSAEMLWDTGLYYCDGQRLVYDSGDYLGCFERALQLVGYSSFRSAQRDAWSRGEYLGSE